MEEISPREGDTQRDPLTKAFYAVSIYITIYCLRFALQIRIEAQGLIGAVIGSESFKEEYVFNFVSSWCMELEKLNTIAKSQPQAAYSVFIQLFRG